MHEHKMQDPGRGKTQHVAHREHSQGKKELHKKQSNTSTRKVTTTAPSRKLHQGSTEKTFTLLMSSQASPWRRTTLAEHLHAAQDGQSANLSRT
jgi:hypothetical protein